MGPQRAALRKRALRPRFVIKAPGASKRRKGHGQLHYSTKLSQRSVDFLPLREVADNMLLAKA